MYNTMAEWQLEKARAESEKARAEKEASITARAHKMAVAELVKNGLRALQVGLYVLVLHVRCFTEPGFSLTAAVAMDQLTGTAGEMPIVAVWCIRWPCTAVLSLQRC
jgi:hypothetical protein